VKLPTAAEVRIVAEELRLSREHFVAVEYRDDAQDMLAAIKMLLQFAELLERRAVEQEHWKQLAREAGWKINPEVE